MQFSTAIITSFNSLSPDVSFPKMTYFYLSMFTLLDSTILLDAQETIIDRIMAIGIIFLTKFISI